jgi:hypothetical protein
MYNLPCGVTQSDVDRYSSICTDEMTVEQFYDAIRNGDTPSESDCPEAVQNAFQGFMDDRCGQPHSHQDDDRSDMWVDFLDQEENNMIQGLCLAEVAA